jgi:4-alpha-glucanotransferase
MALSHNEQIARFGMTTAEALAIRDQALAANIDQTAARQAWQALLYELRGNKGQPFICPQHPEAVRFHMIAQLANGASIADATAAAHAFAFTPLES